MLQFRVKIQSKILSEQKSAVFAESLVLFVLCKSYYFALFFHKQPSHSLHTSTIRSSCNIKAEKNVVKSFAKHFSFFFLLSFFAIKLLSVVECTATD
jgi:hypothetical protein